MLRDAARKVRWLFHCLSSSSTGGVAVVLEESNKTSENGEEKRASL